MNIHSFCLFLAVPTLSLFLSQATGSNLPTGSLPSGSGTAVPSSEEEPVASWVRELSNLPSEQRDAYARAFQAAKKCYAQGRLAECEGHLNTCEFYTRSNPNVWNLRASVLISQQRFAEAEPLLQEVRRANPQDSVARLSLSLLYLGAHDYEKCLHETDQLIEDIKYKDMEQLTHSLTFRKFLCLIMLERMEEARALVAKCSPMDDSPLYYYSQGVFFLSNGDRQSALRDFNAADSIYSNTGYISGYKQALSYSGLVEKLSAPASAGAAQ